MVGHLTNIYCPTVGHLIENLLKKSNAPPMPDPLPLWGLTLIDALTCSNITSLKLSNNAIAISFAVQGMQISQFRKEKEINNMA
jgi:hypothetical protein